MSGKQPKVGGNPLQSKQPRVDHSIQDFGSLTPAWRIGFLDMSGSWGWNVIDRELLFEEILPKIRNFESMYWRDILGPNSHEIHVSDLPRDAQRRLDELKLNDVESLVSLRLTGKKRVWGIRTQNILRLLWWDPEHTVYPSVKKHT